MQSLPPSARRADGRLWAVALGLSLGVNVILMGIFGFSQIGLLELRKKQPVQRRKPAAMATVEIYPEMVRRAAASPPVVEAKPAPPPEFARTSEDQRGKRPDKPAFIGERDTEATSDRTPDASAPPLPSQAGIEPKDETDMETTESRYRDGELRDSPSPPKSDPAPVSPPPSPPAASPLAQETAAAEPPPPRLPEKLLDGPDPVEVPAAKVPEQKPAQQQQKQTPTTATPAAASKPAEPKKEIPRPPIDDPAFAGYQRKTAIRGSISRTGRSALDVEDSPLGRYQAIISRAVELEWQRNCVRHRDLITPGYLTIRFFVEPSGKVRSVNFVNSMKSGEVQKGFTLNSIRDAKIPPMPPAIRKDYAQEPLELIFNFYF